MSEHIDITRRSEPPRSQISPDPGPGLGFIIGILVTVLVVLLLAWLFWLQPSYFPQVQILSIPQTTQPQPVQPDINVPQGGAGGTGGTGGTGQGGEGGTGVVPDDQSAPDDGADETTPSP